MCTLQENCGVCREGASYGSDVAQGLLLLRLVREALELRVRVVALCRYLVENESPDEKMYAESSRMGKTATRIARTATPRISGPKATATAEQ